MQHRITKKILLGIAIISLATPFIVNHLIGEQMGTYGHYFTFINQLGFHVDSLEISIGQEKTKVIATKDSSIHLGQNVKVPKTGYPHRVLFKIYSAKKKHILIGDSFSNFNADGTHEYVLKRPVASYKFMN